MDLYAIYLRKSRMDMEAEAKGEAETLKRHETALLALAKQRRLCIGEIYREVVSGDTIAGRPEMQRLLSDVENGRWKGVLVMEESRLARGDTMDQGRVQQAFYYSHTLIVTPNKIFDPDSEADQEYFEFGLFMSRREYKMINRRLQRGRLASVKEGKWVGARAPYGYKKIKLPREKGNTLEIVPEEAEVVRSIFDWYVHDGISTGAIVRRLNQAGILTQDHLMWTHQTVRGILDNPAYCGQIRYSYRRKDKHTADGKVYYTWYHAPYEDGVTVFPGRHEPIVSKDLFDAALKKRQGAPGSKLRHDQKLQNPFSGLVYCSKCGRVLHRNAAKTGCIDRIVCNYPGCKDTGATTIPSVEALLMDTLRLKLAELEIPEHQQAKDDHMRQLLSDGRDTIQRDLDKIGRQKDTAYDLVEQGVYSADVFASRMEMLAAKENELRAQMDSIATQLSEITSAAESAQILAPKIQHVVDLYPHLEDAEDKNRLLRTCIASIIYSRPKYSKREALSIQVFYVV